MPARPINSVSPSIEGRKVVSSTAARTHFGQLLDAVARAQTPLVIERNGCPMAVMLSVEAYQRLIDRVSDPLAPPDADVEAILARTGSAERVRAWEALMAAGPAQLGKVAARKPR